MFEAMRFMKEGKCIYLRFGPFLLQFHAFSPLFQLLLLDKLGPRLVLERLFLLLFRLFGYLLFFWFVHAFKVRTLCHFTNLYSWLRFRHSEFLYRNACRERLIRAFDSLGLSLHPALFGRSCAFSSLGHVVC